MKLVWWQYINVTLKFTSKSSIYNCCIRKWHQRIDFGIKCLLKIKWSNELFDQYRASEHWTESKNSEAFEKFLHVEWMDLIKNWTIWTEASPIWTNRNIFFVKFHFFLLQNRWITLKENQHWRNTYLCCQISDSYARHTLLKFHIVTYTVQEKQQPENNYQSCMFKRIICWLSISIDYIFLHNIFKLWLSESCST